MRALFIYIFCLSGICLGPLLAYPIQDASSSRSDNRGYNVQTKTGSGDSPRSATPSTTSSRLDRLVGAYMNLVRAELGKQDRQIPAELVYTNANTDDPDYNMFLSNVVPPTNGDAYKSNDDTNIPSDLNDEYDDFGPEKSKRHQQTWYIPYGKRKADMTSGDSIIRHQLRSRLGSNDDDVIYTENGANRLLVSQHGKNRYTPVSDVAFLESMPDGFNMAGVSEAGERNEEARNWDVDNVIRKKKRQAQHRWETQHGGRSADQLYLHVL